MSYCFSRRFCMKKILLTLITLSVFGTLFAVDTFATFGAGLDSMSYYSPKEKDGAERVEDWEVTAKLGGNYNWIFSNGFTLGIGSDLLAGYSVRGSLFEQPAPSLGTNLKAITGWNFDWDWGISQFNFIPVEANGTVIFDDQKTLLACAFKSGANVNLMFGSVNVKHGVEAGGNFVWGGIFEGQPFVNQSGCEVYLGYRMAVMK